MPFLLASCSLPGRRFSSEWNTSSSKNACVGGYAPRPYTGTFSAISYIISTVRAKRCTENSVFLKHSSSDNIGRVFLKSVWDPWDKTHASRPWHIQDRTARMDCVLAPPVLNTDDITGVCARSSCRGTILLRTRTDVYSGSTVITIWRYFRASKK